jgi:threonine aldolase
MVTRLAEDHARAARLAEVLATRFPGCVDPVTIKTNIVCADATRLPDGFGERLRARGVLVGDIDARTVRLVTHKDIDDDGESRAVDALDALALEERV